MENRNIISEYSGIYYLVTIKIIREGPSKDILLFYFILNFAVISVTLISIINHW